MKANLRVNNVDEDLLMRVMEIRFADKSITTPIKSLNRTVPVAGLNEVFHRIDLEKISLISSNASTEMKFNKDAGRDLVIGCYKYTNIPNSTWGVAIGKKRAETTILRHSMPK